MLETLDEIDALWEIDKAPEHQPPEHQDTRAPGHQ